MQSVSHKKILNDWIVDVCCAIHLKTCYNHLGFVSEYVVGVCWPRVIENDVIREDWRSRTRVEILQYISAKWTMAFLIGLCTGLTGFFVNMAVENIAGYKLVKLTYYLNEKR
jgi:hypothetical protein